MDIAGIGEKPITRSGPYFLAVYTLALAISWFTSSQVVRTMPPRPRCCCHSRRASAFSTMLAQASTGLLATASAARQCCSSLPRIIGYFTRLAEYRYQL
jgi:hypothetical protein